ncbi:MAG: response regulator [Tissierellaceae bacterium]
MGNKFIIIDDDMGIITMLKNIIRQNKLGKVVAEYTDGEDTVDEILFYNPDIVLIDYLLPSMDGVEIVNKILDRGFKGKIIMISQVEDQHMVDNAYKSGVLFFIKKPINVIEVVNVIKNVSHNLELERSMSIIKGALGSVSTPDDIDIENSNEQIINNILSDIGIISDPGIKNLIELVNKIAEAKSRDPHSSYKLNDLYVEISKKESDETGTLVNPNTIEQRIRRTIQKSLVNIAEFGIDDYYNPKFMEYSSLLFDFSQVKQEMNYTQGISKRRGTINIKKFIEGIITKLD